MPEDVIVLGGRRYYDPVTCLLLFAAAVKGGAPSELMLELGVDDARIEEIFSSSEQDLAALSQLAALSELLDREMLGRLLRVKLAELLLTARKGTELSALTRAAAKLPPWAFGEAEVEALPQRAAGSARTATKAGAGDVCPACGQEPEDDRELEDAIA